MDIQEEEKGRWEDENLQGMATGGGKISWNLDACSYDIIYQDSLIHLQLICNMRYGKWMSRQLSLKESLKETIHMV